MEKYKNIVSYQIASQLKFIGFDIPTQNRFDKLEVLNKNGQLRYGEPVNWNDKCFNDGYRNYCSAPTYDEVNDWFIKEFKLYGRVEPTVKKNFKSILENDDNNVWYDAVGNDYYFSRHDLILNTINIIKTEFLQEVLNFYSYKISKDKTFLFSFRHLLRLTSLNEYDNYSNIVNIHYENMKEPQPEWYMEKIETKIKNSIIVDKPNIELINLLKEIFTNEILIPLNTDTHIKINLKDKKYFQSNVIIKDSDTIILSSEDAILLLQQIKINLNNEDIVIHTLKTDKSIKFMIDKSFTQVGYSVFVTCPDDKYIVVNLKNKSYQLTDNPPKNSTKLNFELFKMYFRKK